MRPGQSSKRMRGRPNGRKGPNPLTRSYESSGPDVKIRGTAQHIGEKYLQLARDAQASGDPVMAESYLQHAEHYFRLIAMAQQGQQQALGAYQALLADTAADDAEDESEAGAIHDRFASPLERLVPAPQPGYLPPPEQPLPERLPHGNGDRAGFARPERIARPERPFQERSFRERDSQPSPERPNQNQRAYPDRGSRGRDHDNRGGQSRGPRDYRTEVAGLRADGRGEAPFAPSDNAGSGLPAFITAPVRIAAETRDTPASAEAGRQPLCPESADNNVAEGGYPPHPKRRRAVKAEPEVAAAGSGTDENARGPAAERAGTN
jgi:Domain of unknown function (DUF4167)